MALQYPQNGRTQCNPAHQPEFRMNNSACNTLRRVEPNATWPGRHIGQNHDTCSTLRRAEPNATPKLRPTRPEARSPSRTLTRREPNATPFFRDRMPPKIVSLHGTAVPPTRMLEI